MTSISNTVEQKAPRTRAPTAEAVASAYRNSKVAKTAMPSKLSLAFLKYARESVSTRDWEHGRGPLPYPAARMKTFFGEARVPAAVTHALVNGIRAYDTHEAVQLPGVAIMRTGGRLHLVVEQTRRDGSAKASIFDSRGVLALTVVKPPKRQAAIEPLPPDGWS